MTEDNDRKQGKGLKSSHLGKGGQAGCQPIQNSSLGQLQGNDEERNGDPFQYQLYIPHHPSHDCVACSSCETFVLCMLRCRMYLMPADGSALQLCSRENSDTNCVATLQAGTAATQSVLQLCAQGKQQHKMHCNFEGREHSSKNCIATLQAGKIAAQNALHFCRQGQQQHNMHCNFAGRENSSIKCNVNAAATQSLH